MLFTTLLILCLAVAGMATALSYFLTTYSAKWAEHLKAVDQPTGGRKIHTKPIPLFGGVGITLTIILGLGFLSASGALESAGLPAKNLIGYVTAILILLIGGMTDDIEPLSPRLQILFPLSAAVAVLLSGTGIIQVTDPFTRGAFSLTWWHVSALNISLPADVITIGWLLVATYATKLLDGLDGLVAGMAVIGSGIVGVLTLSPIYYQPGVSILSALIGGAFLGFVPNNFHPAKQFLGETGSTLAGFSLGFLAIVSSAKVAIALAVLAIPLADAFFVVLGRLARGVSPWKGDSTHLHFRLLQAGVPHRTVVLLLWGISFSAGVLALTLQTRGKIFLVFSLIILTVLASWFAGRFAKKNRKTK